MTITQVYSIVNAVAQQMYGATAPEITDLQGLISLGNDVVSSDTTKDQFLNVLVDRIGKTIISQRAYSAQVRSLINDSFTFGAILQKLYVAPVAAQQSSQWDLTAGTSVNQYVITKPVVHQKLFSKRDTWEVDITIPDFQLSSAFKSAEEMAAFIDAIFLAIRNSQEIYLEAMGEMCYANMIGERLVHTKTAGGHTAIDLLAMYNALTAPTTLTTQQAMMDVGFLKFASMTINLFVKRMGKMTQIYNSEGYKRFTPPDRLRVVMLADFVSAITSYLQSNTYHDELVALPRYNEIAYWQGIGAGASGFDATGTVAVTTASGYTLKQTHVICMLTDEEAIGLTYDNRRSRSAYNSKGEYTNFFEKADMGYFNDLSENAVIFTVGALAVPTLSSVSPVQSTYSIAGAQPVSVTMTLQGTDAYSAVAVNGTQLGSESVTHEGNTVTIAAAYFAGKAAGDVVEFDIELASNALLPFYVTVTE